MMNRRSLGSPTVRDQCSPVGRKEGSGNPQEWSKTVGGRAAGPSGRSMLERDHVLLAVVVRIWSGEAAPRRGVGRTRRRMKNGP